MKSLVEAIKQAEHEKTHRGITLREYAAVAAMQGLLGSPDYPHGFEALADDAVRQADALIDKLEEVNPKKRLIDKHTGQEYEWCGCGRWVVHGTSHPTLTACNCGAWYKPHVARLNADDGA